MDSNAPNADTEGIAAVMEPMIASVQAAVI